MLRRSIRAVTIASVVGIMVFGFALTATAEDVCIETMPSDAARVRGYTWVGTVTGFDRAPQTGRFMHMDVEHVYADAGPGDDGQVILLQAGAPLDVYLSECAPPTGFERAKRYLISPAFLESPGARFTAVWELQDERAELLLMYGQHPNDTRLEDANTLQEALGLVAPWGNAAG